MIYSSNVLTVFLQSIFKLINEKISYKYILKIIGYKIVHLTLGIIIFVLFNSPKHLEIFHNFLNGRHANMSFTMEFIHILTVFYHQPISLVLFTDLLIDACEFALVGLNYTMN